MALESPRTSDQQSTFTPPAQPATRRAARRAPSGHRLEQEQADSAGEHRQSRC